MLFILEQYEKRTDILLLGVAWLRASLVCYTWDHQTGKRTFSSFPSFVLVSYFLDFISSVFRAGPEGNFLFLLPPEDI
jgi:hypothetical protein